MGCRLNQGIDIIIVDDAVFGVPISPSFILGPRSIKKRQSLDYETEIGVSIIIRTTAVLYSAQDCMVRSLRVSLSFVL